MSNTIVNKTAGYLIKNKLLPGWWLVILVGFFLALWLNYEDYLGSIRGYDSIGTQAVTGNTRFVVGALPQVVQLILSLYIINALGLETRTLIFYIIGWAIFFGLDAYTDYLYLTSVPNATFAIKVWAAIQAVAMYTLGSEWLFMATFGLLFRITPAAIQAWVEFFTTTWDAVGSFLSNFSDVDDLPDEPTPRRQPQSNVNPRQHEGHRPNRREGMPPPA